ncbi:3-dehydroshikimate dehydratase [Cyphellophora attinorum]|uniref:3-dehydroshikimate dehydratase n=1 Tax=Cyphellophora attinorum TaxID=1664694 RepID=A0A0N0NIE2_9EURO|nr:3-dehydroshikimate dehydratase [Phialophora attinorum]KPI35638.1 3-dehydroshikimate dehydratase [Phialophora attinorum]
MNNQLAVATISLGWHECHTLESKLEAIKQSGIQGIELCDYDLTRYASHHRLDRKKAAELIGELCKDLKLTVVAYASFEKFEGQLKPLNERLEKAQEWCDIAARLGMDMIQVSSNTDPEANGDEAVIVSDLRSLAELGQCHEPPIRFAYEALAFGVHVADWEESLRIVKLVDQKNFGLCLDTYHVLGRLWADPSSHSGKRPGGDAAMRDTLQRFRDLCPPERIFYIQLSDGEFANPPILPGHVAYDRDTELLFSWCLYGRIFPLEREYGAYLPMEDILRTWLVESGWTGWVSMEVFHHSMREETAGPTSWTVRAVLSWDRVQKMLEA